MPLSSAYPSRSLKTITHATARAAWIFSAAICVAPLAFAAPVILNEYNAVAGSSWLNGGDASGDDDGELASDGTLGRVQGNGGDWFELVIVEAGLDLRGWQLELMNGDAPGATLTLGQDALWTTLQAGSIVTVSEDQPEDVSYDPANGDWSVNVRAGDSGSGVYVSALSFKVDNDDWQLVIRDAAGVVRFGPSGEGVVPGIGVGGTETWRLEEDPSAFVEADSTCADDADTTSTFGAPNVWASGRRIQRFDALRVGTAPTSQCDSIDLTPLAFDPDHIIEVEISMDPADFELLRREQRNLMDTFGGACGENPAESPYAFYPGTVTVDGTTVIDAGVRKKGFFGSIDRGKPSFKIDFGEFGSGHRPYGMDRLTLNNSRQDPSLMDSCLGYGLYRAAGLPAARCNHAHVTVNGESMGIYTHIESMKEPFLERAFGDASGQLYEGSVADFRDNWIGLIENKNSDDDAPLLAIQAAIEIEDDAEALAAIMALIDFDRFLTGWALDGLIGNWDGYSGNANNYWLYENPSTGLYEFLPWSLDDLFGRDNPFTGGLFSGDARTWFDNSAVSNRLWRIPAVRAQYDTRLRELVDTVWDEVALAAEIDRMEALLSPVAGDLSPYTSETRAWIDRRVTRIDADFAEGPPAEAITLQPKVCLVEAGSIAGEFEAVYESPVSLGLPPESNFTPTSFEFGELSVLFGLATSFGEDPAVGPGKLVLRPIGLISADFGYIFNIAIDEGDVQAGTAEPIAVADSVTSLILGLTVSPLDFFPVGVVYETTVEFDVAELEPEGQVTGRFTSQLAVWVPHPVPEPGAAAQAATALAALAWLKRRAGLRRTTR